MKWAIFKGKIGMYAMEYIENIEDCKNLMGGFLIKKEDLPIVVNSCGVLKLKIRV